MNDLRKETDSLGEVNVAADKLWGAAAVLEVENIPQPAVRAPAVAKRA
jgi:fumarate hydratase class II